MDATAQISLYTTLFYVSVGITVLGFVLAVFFFFFFDIPAVFAMMTGRAKKETIRRMEEQNAKTGNLRFQYPSGGLGKSGRTGGKTGRTEKTAKTARTAEFPSPPPAVPTQEPRAETSVLQRPTMETTVLNNEAGQTMPLNMPPQPKPQRPSPIPFRMTENTLVIHTDEMI